MINLMRNFILIMGLDMSLFKEGKTPQGKIALALDSKSNKQHNIELAYWRKSYDLHDKFLSYAVSSIAIKVAKGKYANKEVAKAMDLNCKKISLTKEDLIEIKSWCAWKIQEEDYDDNDYYRQDYELAIETIEKALKETDFEHEIIYYWSWW